MAVLQELKQQGHPVDAMWASMKDAIVKTLLVVQPYLSRVYESSASRSTGARTNTSSTNAGNGPNLATKSSSSMAGDSIRQKSQCFELLGFDIILDNKFKPWVLEVNHSPSLTCDAEIDLEVKQALLRDTLELLGFSNHGEGSQSFLAYRKQVLKGDKKEAARRLFQSNGTVSAAGGLEKTTTSGTATSQPPPDPKLTQEGWEDAHMGSFERLYPVRDLEQTARYDNYLRVAKQVMALDQKETNSTKGRKEFIQKQQRQRELASMKFSSALKKAKDLTAAREKVRQSSIGGDSVISETEKSAGSSLAALSKVPTGAVPKLRDTTLKTIRLESYVEAPKVHTLGEAQAPSTSETSLSISLPETKRFPSLKRITSAKMPVPLSVIVKREDTLVCVGRNSSGMSPVTGRAFEAIAPLARSRTSSQLSTAMFPSPFATRKTLPSLNTSQSIIKSRYTLDARKQSYQLATSGNADYSEFAKSLQVIEKQISWLHKAPLSKF